MEDKRAIWLADKCQQETSLYRRGISSSTQHCFELFRLAIVEKKSEAIAAIFRIYTRLIHYWVSRHPAFSRLDLPIEYFVADSISEFFLAVEKIPFDNFSTLAQLMSYWRKCVNTVLVTADRKRAKLVQIDTAGNESFGNVGYREQFDLGASAAEIWNYIEILLEEDDDILLARLRFIQNQPPRKICAAFPDKWPNVNKVRVALQRIRRKLHKDAGLKELFELGV